MDWKRKLIEKLGGFVDVDDCIEQIKSIDNLEERNKVLSLSVKKLFNTVGKDDILKRYVQGNMEQWWFEGKLLSPEEVKSLKREAESFRAMRLYKVLDMECRYQANKKMHEAQTLSQLESAKLLIWTWDVIKSRLREM